MSYSWTILPGSTGRMVIAESIKRGTASALCALFLLIFLTSCGPAEPSARGSSSSSGSVTATRGAPIGPISAPAPPGASNRPLEPGQSGTQYMPNGLPVLPPRGVNADMLFAEKITDPDDRFRRLENAVTDLRREFDAVMPAIVRLSAVEQDMQDLLGQLQTLVQNSPSAPDMELDSAPVPPVTADALPPASVTAQESLPAAPPEAPPDRGPPPPPEEEPGETVAALPALKTADAPPVSTLPPEAETPEKPPDAAPPVSTGPPPAQMVQGIRVGVQDNGAQRLVLDLSGPTPHHLDLDNEEHLLLVEMPEAGWSADPEGSFANAPLLTSWTTEPMNDGKGTRLILQLPQNVVIASDSALADPDRIVVDLRKSP